MREDQLFFWGGLLAALLGCGALLMDHVVFHGDLLEPATTPHSPFFGVGVIVVLAGGAALIAAFVRD